MDREVMEELEAMRPSAYHQSVDSRSSYFRENPRLPSLRIINHQPPTSQTARQKPPVVVMDPKSPVMIHKMDKFELERLIARPAITSEEKYRVLDARDRLIRLRGQTNDIQKVEHTKGQCPDMCPEKERLMREAKHQIAVYEMDEGSRYTINHKVAVKQYSRSSADQESPLPHELRAEPVLRMTMAYLLYEIADLCDQPDCNMSDWYHFLWDRTRSIRKDITQQELCCQGSVALVEQCARFHIHCSARLVAEEPQVFDQKINTENLTKCLQSLKYMYHDLRLKNERCPNEPEFRAYIVLLNLNDSNFLWEVKQLPNEVQKSPEIKFAISIFLAIENNNYVQFFKLVRRTTYLNACILLRYFTQVRARALATIIKAYCFKSPVHLSISNLYYLLAFDDMESAAQFFEYYGLQCDRDMDRVFIDRSSFYYPDMPFIMDRAINVVELKRYSTVGQVIAGGELPPKSIYQNHVPQSSFDSRGVFRNNLKDALEIGEIDEDVVVISDATADSEEEEEFNSDEEENDSDSEMEDGEIDEKNQTEEEVPLEKFKKPLPVFRSSSAGIFSMKSFDQTDKSATAPPGNNIFGSVFSGSSFEVAKNQNNNIFGRPSSIEVEQPFAKTVTFELDDDEEINGGEASTSSESDSISDEEEEETTEVDKEAVKERIMQEMEIKCETVLEEVLEEGVAEALKPIAIEELNQFKAILASCHKEKDKIVDETIEEAIFEIAHEENLLHHAKIYSEQKTLARLFRGWSRFTKHIKLSKEKVQSAPNWMPSVSIQDQVDCLKLPKQEENLKYKERYLSGRPVSLDLSSYTGQPVSVVRSVGCSLMNIDMPERVQRYYWKAIISIPGTNEEKVGFYEYVLRWLRNSLDYSSDRPDCFYFKEGDIDHLHSICISLRLLVGKELMQENKSLMKSNSENVEGLVFIMSEEGETVDARRRLKALLYAFRKKPINLVVMNVSSAVRREDLIENLELQSLKESGEIKDFTVLSSIERSALKPAIEKSLLTLSMDYAVPYKHLKMQPLTDILRETVGSPFWKRLEMNSQVNPITSDLSHRWSQLVSIYNEGVSKLDEIFCGDWHQNGLDFSPEFRDSLPNSPLVSNFPYFPADWNTVKLQNTLRNFIKSLHLSAFEKSDSDNASEVLQNLQQYLSGLFGDHEATRVFWSVVRIIQEKKDPSVRPNWMKPIELIVNNLLEKRLRDYENLPARVVYDEEKLKSYLNFPWWLQNKIMKRRFEYDVETVVSPPKKLRYSADLDDLNGVLLRAKKALERAEVITTNFNESKQTLLNVSQNYDLRLSKIMSVQYQ